MLRKGHVTVAVVKPWAAKNPIHSYITATLLVARSPPLCEVCPKLSSSAIYPGVGWLYQPACRAKAFSSWTIATARATRAITAMNRNLLQRPAKPALSRGRIQRAARRAFDPHRTNMDQKISRSLRNLRRRPAKPALGNGRLQRAARRALWALQTASTAEIAAWTYCMRAHRGERLGRWCLWNAKRALRSIGAVKAGRAATRGRPWMWKL